MKKIKNINGYAIYEAGDRDVKKYGFAAGSFYVYFASDIRDFGLSGSTPEFEDCGSIEDAEANCTGNFAIAKELVEARTTAASMDEILEVEAQLDAGADPDAIANAEPMIPDATGSLRAVARESADNLRDGIPWVIIYRAGRSWGCLAIWSDVWNSGFETDDINHALEILRIDSGAVILNGYYCGHFGENMTVDELTTGIRWHYENGYNRLADCEDVQRAQASIETARAAAKAAGLPFSERLSAGAEDEPDPYTYDGSMTPEDYDAMQAARDTHEALCAVAAERFPGMEPDTLDKLASAAAGLHIAPEELGPIFDAFSRVADAVKELAAKIVEAVKAVAEFAVTAARNLYDTVARCCVPPKWIYLSKHAKRARTRKKYRNRIRRDIIAALAMGGGGSE